MDLNKVMLIGRITNDLEVKKLPESWNSVLSFTLATNRRYKNKEDNFVEEAEFHRCVVFGNWADNLAKYQSKWSKLYVEWRLRTRKWEDTNWNAKFTTEIVLENFIFLDNKWESAWSSNKSTHSSESSSDSHDTGSWMKEDDLPF